jgi:hypothetical protein
MRKVKASLERMGHTICNGWLEESNAQELSTLTDRKRRVYSYRDIGEIVSVDLLVIDTQEESSSGGREVEYGMALAFGKPVWVVGPQRNIFHSVCRRQFDDWEPVLKELECAGV